MHRSTVLGENKPSKEDKINYNSYIEADLDNCVFSYDEEIIEKRIQEIIQIKKFSLRSNQRGSTELE